MATVTRGLFDLQDVLSRGEAPIETVRTHTAGPAGSMPLSEEMLRDWPCGDVFGLTQNAGMGWPVAEMLGPQFVLLSTQGGIRAEDGTPIALGYHTGHWEVGLLVQAAARELKAAGGVPFAAFCSDPCDGRTQGTTGMFDSLPYRNDAATIFRRLIRSLPTRQGVLGVATCDKGLPAMMLALAGTRDLPCVLVPGGVSLLPTEGEDAGKVQSIGARFAHGELSLEEASVLALPGMCFARRRLPVSGDRGHIASRCRGLGARATTLRARPVGAADLARYGPPQRPRSVESSCPRHQSPRHHYRCRGAQRHGRTRGLRRLNQPFAARAGDRLRRRS